MKGTNYMAEVHPPSTTDAKKYLEDDMESLNLVDKMCNECVIVDAGIRGLLQ